MEVLDTVSGIEALDMDSATAVSEEEALDADLDTVVSGIEVSDADLGMVVSVVEALDVDFINESNQEPVESEWGFNRFFLERPIYFY